MKTLYFPTIAAYLRTIVASVVVIVGLIFYFQGPIGRWLDTYAITCAEHKFGALSLSPAQEEKIRNIAQEMKVTTPFVIRKMNRTALLTFGYHNAFVYFSDFLHCIPLNNTPMLFVSEGFFDDLSDEEARFLIGHELIHVQEHHTQYLNLIMFSIIILLCILCCFTKKTIVSSIHNYVPIRYASIISRLIVSCLVCICCLIPTLGSLAYRRHIEWVADYMALTTLKEYDGACKLIQRWQKEFKLPLHNPYLGLLSDHPSCHERTVYCLDLKNTSKETIL